MLFHLFKKYDHQHQLLTKQLNVKRANRMCEFADSQESCSKINSLLYIKKYSTISDNVNSSVRLSADRGNEYSDEDEENEFSSTEDAYDGNDGIGLTGYEAGSGSNKQRQQDSMLRKYRKLDRRDVSAEASGGGKGGGGGGGAAVVDSDSEFENLKEKGSRAKISRVSESGTWRWVSVGEGGECKTVGVGSDGDSSERPMSELIE